MRRSDGIMVKRANLLKHSAKLTRANRATRTKRTIRVTPSLTRKSAVKCQLRGLPVELWLNIVDELDERKGAASSASSDIKALSLACVSFYGLAQRYLFRTCVIRFRDDPSGRTAAPANLLLSFWRSKRIARFVRHAYIKHSTRFDHEAPLDAAIKCLSRFTKLRKLFFEEVTLRDHHLNRLSGLCSLQHVEISDSYINAHYVPRNILPVLSLKWEQCWNSQSPAQELSVAHWFSMLHSDRIRRIDINARDISSARDVLRSLRAREVCRHLDTLVLPQSATLLKVLKSIILCPDMSWALRKLEITPQHGILAEPPIPVIDMPTLREYQGPHSYFPGIQGSHLLCTVTLSMAENEDPARLADTLRRLDGRHIRNLTIIVSHMTTDLLKLAYSRFNYLISLTVQEINPYFLNELPSFAIPSQSLLFSLKDIHLPLSIIHLRVALSMDMRALLHERSFPGAHTPDRETLKDEVTIASRFLFVTFNNLKSVEVGLRESFLQKWSRTGVLSEITIEHRDGFANFQHWP